MEKDFAQEQRLDILLDAFMDELPQQGDRQKPYSITEKRQLLRSLMNIRRPGSMSKELLSVQDKYLKSVIEQKGMVRLSDIPVMRDGISIWQGDITRLVVDAIVNAANSQMLGCFVPLHTCIDNCIHTFAGVQLRGECYRQMNRLKEKYGSNYEQPTAVPLLTDGYNLPAKKIIHVVGPIVVNALTKDLEDALAMCYKNVLDMCKDNGLRSVAFCCISTGVFHFPNRRAAEIATETVSAWLKAHPGQLERVIFNVFKDEDRSYYEQLI